VSMEQTGDAVSAHRDGLSNPVADGETERTSNADPNIKTDPDTIKRVATRTRQLVRERLRAVLDGRTAAAPTPQLRPLPELDDDVLDRIADEETQRADGALVHVAVIHAVSDELGIRIEDAVEHPAVDLTRQLLRPAGSAAPPDANRARPTRQRALLLDAVHVFGIETLEPGDEDIELRLADAGIDVRKPSTAEMIGRLRWNEIRSVAVQRPRRGLPGRRRPALFVAGTDRGEVTFELPGVSDDEITEHLEPLIARNCAGNSDPNAS
jgi:hypothetical protein